MSNDPSLLPTFIIGGAPRSGTTFLAQALDLHPDVYMAKPFIPEPKVFMGEPRVTAWYRQRYAELFAAAAGHKARGEKTSYYLESDEARVRIRSVLPGVRLLFILREPVSRAYSNYLWSRKNGLETVSFEEAVELEGRRVSPLPPEKAYARPFDYLSRGDYAHHARAYYETYGRDAVFFCLYEDLACRPGQLLRRVQEWVGVDPQPLESHPIDVVNSAREVGPPIRPATDARLRERLRPSVEQFGALTGLDLSAWGY
jgi:hypothetical protein